MNPDDRSRERRLKLVAVAAVVATVVVVFSSIAIIYLVTVPPGNAHSSRIPAQTPESDLRIIGWEVDEDPWGNVRFTVTVTNIGSETGLGDIECSVRMGNNLYLAYHGISLAPGETETCTIIVHLLAGARFTDGQISVTLVQ